MRILIALMLLTTPAFAQVYSVVEGDVVMEYDVRISSKSRDEVLANIRNFQIQIEAHNREISLLLDAKENAQDKIANLESVLAELPVPVVPEIVVEPEPVVEPEVVTEPEVVVDTEIYTETPQTEGMIVDESVYPDLNSDSGINW